MSFKHLLLVGAGAAILTSGTTAVTTTDCKKKPLLSPLVCCNDQAPDNFNVTFTTTVGNGKEFTLVIARNSAPIGVDRFYNMAKCHYFDNQTVTGNEAGFFRVVTDFVVQFGISGNVDVSAAWENLILANDPVILSNVRGTIAYAAEQDSSGMAVNRTTQVYINYGNNSNLDAIGFAPFGYVPEMQMKIVEEIFAGYAQDPDQDSIYAEGDAYLKKNFPKLDYITATTVTM